MALVESQHRTLENQKVEHQETLAQVAPLQNEVTMLRHSVSTPTPVQDLNGAINQKELINIIKLFRQEIRQIQAKPVQPPVMIPIVMPPYNAMSVCTGFPPGQSVQKNPEGPSPKVEPKQSQNGSPKVEPKQSQNRNPKVDPATAIPRGSDNSSNSSPGGPTRSTRRRS